MLKSILLQLYRIINNRKHNTMMHKLKDVYGMENNALC